MLNYADEYGDLCPWNPGGNYQPGCGYGYGRIEWEEWRW